MNTKVTTPIFIRTFFLFPIFMIFVLIPIMILIIIASFLPYGKLIATKLYEFFGWVGLKFVGIKLIVKGAEKIDLNKKVFPKLKDFSRIEKEMSKINNSELKSSLNNFLKAFNERSK